MTIFMDQEFNVQVLLNDAMVKSAAGESGTEADGGEIVGEVPGTAGGGKDPLLSSWPFVIGITAVTMAVSILFGILLAKRKIKKGYELYED
ncbi:hypothetical protein Ana3638_08405 [Anaerocolumna sedimenticola]|uniref:Uncharacterized protein n=1 Tax=Anaerocolumna sedimenticola TaxID=2696063 RepID=A0A6P1THV3_9FIRM|nr:hypothetical protein [Anaerocolumna sedimenticola]QHQ60790.1 hypothetical protein Ana3638_08405 [Anaerocolumna sedimenticola]